MKRFLCHVDTMIASCVCHAMSVPVRAQACYIPSCIILGRVRIHINHSGSDRLPCTCTWLTGSSCIETYCSLIEWWEREWTCVGVGVWDEKEYSSWNLWLAQWSERANVMSEVSVYVYIMQRLYCTFFFKKMLMDISLWRWRQLNLEKSTITNFLPNAGCFPKTDTLKYICIAEYIL